MQSLKKIVTNGLIILSLSFGLTISAVAVDFNQAQLLTSQGSADVQYNIGMLYDQGQGVRQDYFKARQWYEKAASQGSAEAQMKLGIYYHLGLGVTQNTTTAVEWYGKACNNGFQLGCVRYRLFKE